MAIDYPSDCGAGDSMKVDGNMQTDNGSYPTWQVLNYSHDNVATTYDSYYSGGWKSADAGSNFRIYKIGDKLRFSFASNVAAGSTISAWSNENNNVAMCIDKYGKVGVGTTTPASSLTVSGGNMEADTAGAGLILRSPDGTRWKITVSNTGTLTVGVA